MPTISPSKLVPGVIGDEHDLLVYYVDSRTPGEAPWRVDLQRFNGAGFCDCPDFKYRKAKYLLRRAMPSESLECYHIKAAKRYFTFECLNRIIEKREYEANANKEAARQSRVDRRISETASQAKPTGEGTSGNTAAIGKGRSSYAQESIPYQKPEPNSGEWRGDDTEDTSDTECPF